MTKSLPVRQAGKIQNKSKCQISNNKTVVLIFVILILNLFCALNFDICHLYVYAQESNKLVTLTKQIMETQDSQGLFGLFKELKELYFSRPAIKPEGGIPPEAGGEIRYSDFVEMLKSLAYKQNRLEPFTSYYIALARYHQLKYLEENQKWDEYFSDGNTYRDEITTFAKKAVDATTPKEKLNLYARLILWQFHKDQDDTFQEDALSDLMDATLEYSQNATDITPLKDIAGQFLAYNEKGKARELYKIYVEQLAASNINNSELERTALGFFKEKNLELSELVYDIYIERIRSASSLENPLPILKDIAKAFSYKCKETRDALYAEKIFQKLQEIGGKDTFDEELTYLRASNLERVKEYEQAKEIYKDLIQRYPKAVYFDEATFKLGIIYTYVLRDIRTGRNYFGKLAQKEIISPSTVLGTDTSAPLSVSPRVISSLYQLGLLSQWENEPLKATEYYNKLIDTAGTNSQETVTLAKERLKEINEAKPIEYNLKVFLDVSLKEENAIFDTTKVDLRCCPYRVKKDESVNISSNPYELESGCMQPEVQYLWSGHIGRTKPSLEQSSFDTTYTDSGTKEINLVVVSPTGIIDRNIDMVDVD
jgi:TolA-binding protein